MYNTMYVTSNNMNISYPTLVWFITLFEEQLYYNRINLVIIGILM